MKTKMQVTGVQATLRAFGKAKSKDAIAIAAGLAKSAEIILRKSQIYVPVELGDLKATGMIGITGAGFGTEAIVSYGGLSPTGRDVFYALAVHENLAATHAPPTCARYLARAVRETRGTCASVLRRSMTATDPATALAGIAGGGSGGGGRGGSRLRAAAGGVLRTVAGVAGGIASGTIGGLEAGASSGQRGRGRLR